MPVCPLNPLRVGSLLKDTYKELRCFVSAEDVFYMIMIEVQCVMINSTEGLFSNGIIENSINSFWDYKDTKQLIIHNWQLIKPSPLVENTISGEGFVSFPKAYDLAGVVGVSLPLTLRVERTLMAVFVSVMICVTVSAKWRYLVASTIFIVVA